MGVGRAANRMATSRCRSPRATQKFDSFLTILSEQPDCGRFDTVREERVPPFCGSSGVRDLLFVRGSPFPQLH